MPLYKLDELTEGSAFEQEYDKAIAEGLSHVDAAERATKIVVEELTPQKVLRYALVIKNFRAEITAIKMEVEKLAARAKAKANKIEFLEMRMESLLPRDFLLEDAKAVVKFKKLPDVVFIDDESIIPDNFKTVVPASSSLKKDDIGKALKAGDVVAGAHLVKNRTGIMVK